MDKKSNHRANVVRITEIKPHSNADTLAIIPVGEYQAVVKKDEFKVDDFAVYIQPDSIVPQTDPFKFIWENYEGLDGVVPEKRRRITVRKFRGEWSEGLLLPIAEVLPQNDLYGGDYDEGTDVSEIIGITHYDPDKGKENTGDFDKPPRKKRGRPKSLRGWFWYLVRFLGIYGEGGKSVSGWDTEDGGKYAPVYDVEALKNYADVFNEGEEVFVTEKIHGSNARYLYLDGHLYAGSRTQWKAETSPCIWRKALKFNPWIEEWCKANEGYILYGEVTPTQGDKWIYGSKNPQFFAFDIYTPEGEWLNPLELHTVPTGFQIVPLISRMPFDLEKIKTYVDGPSTIKNGPSFREGIVVAPSTERQIRGLGRLKLKLVSPDFLSKDSK
jgi:RNA ligase